MNDTTSTLTRTVGEGTFWTSAGNIILKVVYLGTLFVILRNLSVYQYGLIELILSVFALMSVFTLPGLSNVVIADMGIEKGKGNLREMKSIFLSFVRLIAILSIIPWAIVFFGAELFSAYYGANVEHMLQIISFLFLVTPFSAGLTVVFRVYLKFFLQVYYRFLTEVSKLILIIVMFYCFSPSPTHVVLATLVCEIVALVFILPHFLKVYRKFPKEPVIRTGLFDLLRDHGKWGIFSTYLGSFAKNMRIWIIKLFLGTEVVGIVAVAQGLIQHTASLFPLNLILKPIIPQYVEDKPAFIRLILKGVKFQFAGFMIVGITAFLFFPPIISFVFPQYESALPLFKIMLLGLIPMSAGGAFAAAFYALKKQKNLTFAICVQTVSIVILLPISIFMFGTVGIAYEFILTGFVFQAERYLMLRKLIKGFRLRLKDLYTFDKFDCMLFRKAKERLRHSFVFAMFS